MTVRDIYVSTEENQKLIILEADTNRMIWAGFEDSTPYELFDCWVSNLSCQGATLIITIDPD